MQFNSVHPFTANTVSISELVMPLEQLGITYFNYFKSYNNGHRIYLSNHADTLQAYLELKFYTVGHREFKPEIYRDQLLLWSTLPNQYIFDNVERSYGFDHGLYIIKSYSNWVECFGFASNKNNIQVINTYLNNIDFLIRFTQQFKNKSSRIIKDALNANLILPFNNNDQEFIQDYTDMSLIKGKVLIAEHLKKETLTDRQIQCCSLLMSGKTASEIGETLKLSPRTVEYYLSIAKTKLGCNNKAEMIAKLSILMTNQPG